MTKTTMIKNASWVVAWDGKAQTYRRDVDVVFRGGTITHVGGDYTGRSSDRRSATTCGCLS